MQLRIRVQQFILILCLLPSAAFAQVTGGQFAFQYLLMPQSPHISALGGINICNPDDDISLALQNPALMRPGMHNELSLNYNAYYAGIKSSNLSYGYDLPKIKTSFVLGVQYIDYGSFDENDNIGNTLGSVHGLDYAVTLGASRAYGNHWRYGAALKYASSTLADKSASAMAADVGVVYFDTSSLVTMAITAKNMGAELGTYNGIKEPIPFDLQLGLSKRFAHLPLRIMVTVHHLYEWDVRYNNPADISQTNLFGTADTTADTKSHFADKLFRHFTFAGELSLGKRILLNIAYNQLRRGELALDGKSGLAGFSFGGTILLNKLQIHYARSYYHIAGAYNEFGLNLALNKLIGVGKSATGHSHWNDQEPDWGM